MTRPLGKLERLAYERHERDLAEGAARGLYFDEKAAGYAVRWIEKYAVHVQGEWAGKPLLLEPFQKFIVRSLFGWKRADKLRRFRTAWIEEARKNGKSSLAAAIGLLLLVADGEPGAEVYASATKRDQAKIVWGTAARMVRRSASLQRAARAYRTVITCGDGKFEALGSDANTTDGLNPSANIVDEVHAHKTRELWDVLDTALGARRQPLTLAITTAGRRGTETIGWEQHEYARQVLEGVLEDDALFAFIAAADEGDDYFSVDAQKKANPGYGVMVKPDYLARQAEKAQRQPSFLNEYLRLHLNIWTSQITRWLSVERWDECDGAPLDLAALAGRSCYGGLDLASKLDLAAFVLVFPDEDGDDITLLPRFWIPEATIEEHARRGQRHYETWAREGCLSVTPGDVIDYDVIRAGVNELGQRFAIQEIGFDPWNATQIATQLEADGFVMVQTRQGYKTLSEPSKDLEAKVVGRKVRHGGHPILRWCVSNAVVDTDPAGNIKPAKDKASGKIDGVVATVIALSRIISGEESAYADGGGLKFV